MARITTASGEVDVAAQTADGNSVVYYYGFPGQAFNGPVTVGPSYPGVQPAMAVRPDGEIDIVTLSPDAHLEYYWNFPGGPFSGPLQIGTSTFANGSNPQILVRNNTEVDVAAIDDSHRLDYYWDFAGSAFNGPAVVQTNAFEGEDGLGLTMALRPGGELDVVSNAAATPGALTDNALTYFWDFPGRPFQGPVPVTSALVDGSSQGLVVRPNGEADVAYSTFDGANYHTFFVTDIPGQLFGSPTPVGSNEEMDALVGRPNGEDDLITEPETSASANGQVNVTWTAVDYRWSFIGTPFAGPVQALNPAGDPIATFTSLGIGSDGVAHAANCLALGGDSYGIVYSDDVPGHQFSASGLVGPGCAPTVVARG